VVVVVMMMMDRERRRETERERERQDNKKERGLHQLSSGVGSGIGEIYSIHLNHSTIK